MFFQMSPPSPPQPCVLVFIIILLLVCVATLLLRLDEIEQQLVYIKPYTTVLSRRLTVGSMVCALIAAIVAMALLLVWARLGECA